MKKIITTAILGAIVAIGFTGCLSSEEVAIAKYGFSVEHQKTISTDLFKYTEISNKHRANYFKRFEEISIDTILRITEEDAINLKEYMIYKNSVKKVYLANNGDLVFSFKDTAEVTNTKNGYTSKVGKAFLDYTYSVKLLSDKTGYQNLKQVVFMNCSLNGKYIACNTDKDGVYHKFLKMAESIRTKLETNFNKEMKIAVDADNANKYTSIAEQKTKDEIWLKERKELLCQKYDLCVK